MSRLTRIGIMFAGKLTAIFMAGIGLIAGIAYSVGGAIYDFMTGPSSLGTALAFMALIGMPALFAVLGFLAGIVGAAFYNFIATRTGGISIDVEQSDQNQ